MEIKSLDRLSDTIDKLNDLSNGAESVPNNKICAIVTELINTYVDIEDDFYRYINKIEEIEEDIEFKDNPQLFVMDNID